MNATASTAPSFERFQQLLFAPEDQSAYAVLDGASVPDLLDRLAEAKEDHCCLYRGELEPDLAEVAPYLIKLRRDSTFTQAVFTEGWGNHWGIFTVTPVGLESLRRHLRRFLRVKDHTGQVLYFRYYDPRVLRVYLPTCNRNEIKTIYGPIARFIAEDEATREAVIFPCDSLRIKPITQPLN